MNDDSCFSVTISVTVTIRNHVGAQELHNTVTDKRTVRSRIEGRTNWQVENVMPQPASKVMADEALLPVCPGEGITRQSCNRVMGQRVSGSYGQ